MKRKDNSFDYFKVKKTTFVSMVYIKNVSASTTSVQPRILESFETASIHVAGMWLSAIGWWVLTYCSPRKSSLSESVCYLHLAAWCHLPPPPPPPPVNRPASSHGHGTLTGLVTFYRRHFTTGHQHCWVTPRRSATCQLPGNIWSIAWLNLIKPSHVPSLQSRFIDPMLL